MKEQDNMQQALPCAQPEMIIRASFIFCKDWGWHLQRHYHYKYLHDMAFVHVFPHSTWNINDNQNNIFISGFLCFPLVENWVAHIIRAASSSDCYCLNESSGNIYTAHTVHLQTQDGLYKPAVGKQGSTHFTTDKLKQKAHIFSSTKLILIDHRRMSKMKHSRAGGQAELTVSEMRGGREGDAPNRCERTQRRVGEGAEHHISLNVSVISPRVIVLPLVL